MPEGKPRLRALYDNFLGSGTARGTADTERFRLSRTVRAPRLRVRGRACPRAVEVGVHKPGSRPRSRRKKPREWPEFSRTGVMRAQTEQTSPACPPIQRKTRGFETGRRASGKTHIGTS